MADYRPVQPNPPFSPPNPRFYSSDLPRHSTASDLTIPPPSPYAQSFADSDSVRGLAAQSGYRDSDEHANNSFPEKRERYAAPKAKASRRGCWTAAIIGVVLLALAGAAVPVYFFVIKPKLATSTSGKSTPASTPKPTSTTGNNLPVSGGDGTIITLDDGRTFTYKNSFGGTWYYDPADPFNNAAQAQLDSPPLNQPWNWATDRIRGVNLGGWLNLEPFISPAPFEKYATATPPAIDEWTLSMAMANDPASGGLAQLEDHYKTFITEEDFAAIAAAGLNWVRIPIGFWAIETYPEEPFLAQTSWQYFLKAIQWARKYGIRINIDLHALPGSQNGWNHSGKGGEINVLKGVMGLANAQRALSYIRVIAEFISQPQYRDVVPFFGIVNEARLGGDNIPVDAMRSFYLQAYEVIRNAGGTNGNGPVISIHEGFVTMEDWVGFLGQPDRLAMDQHPYNAFDPPTNATLASFITKPCGKWATDTTASLATFGITGAGEFSNAVNDCGLFVNGVGLGTRWEGDFAGGKTTPIGSCTEWTDWPNWDAERRAELKEYMMTQMDALQNWFFWTWKIGNSSVSGRVESPFWSYSLALQEGWAPTDPRDAIGACARHGTPIVPFDGSFQPYQIGGVPGAPVPDAQKALYPWPPTTIGGIDPLRTPIAELPSFTATGPIPTLPVPTVPAGVDAGNGWNNPADVELMNTKVAGCAYPDAWNATDAVLPLACAGAPAAVAPAPTETAATKRSVVPRGHRKPRPSR